jgi:hypothetical protein
MALRQRLVKSKNLLVAAFLSLALVAAAIIALVTTAPCLRACTSPGKPALAQGSPSSQHIFVGLRPHNVTNTWYSNAAAVNTPIPAGTPYSPHDSTLIKAMTHRYCSPHPCLQPVGGGNGNVYLASSKTPTQTVEVYPTSNCTPAAVYQVPIPAGVVGPYAHSTSDNEARLDIVVSDTGAEWDMYKTRDPGYQANPHNAACGNNRAGVWSAAIAHRASPALGTGGWEGLGNESYSSRASGLYDGVGLIRPRDTQMPPGSTWPHALVLSYPATLDRHVYPATSTDGHCTDAATCLPEGARLQLDHRFRCSVFAHEWQRQMCRTLKVYGVIIADSSAPVVVRAGVCRTSCSGGGVASESDWSVGQPNADNNGILGYAFPWDPRSRAAVTGIPALDRQVDTHMHVIDWTKWVGRPRPSRAPHQHRHHHEKPHQHHRPNQTKER